MGAVLSNEVQQTLSDYTSAVNTAIQNTYTTNSSSCSASNTYSLTAGILPDGGPCRAGVIEGQFQNNQTATSNCTLQEVDTINQSASFKNTIETTTLDFITQQLKNKQGFLATAFSIASNKDITQSDVANAISNYFQQSIAESCSNYIDSTNQYDVAICGFYYKPTFDNNQNAIVTGATSCVNDITIKAFTYDTTLNTFYNNTLQALKNKQAGATGFLVTIAVIIIAVIVLLVLLFFAYFMLTKATTGKSGKSPGLSKPSVSIPTSITTPTAPPALSKIVNRFREFF